MIAARVSPQQKAKIWKDYSVLLISKRNTLSFHNVYLYHGKVGEFHTKPKYGSTQPLRWVSYNTFIAYLQMLLGGGGSGESDQSLQDALDYLTSVGVTLTPSEIDALKRHIEDLYGKNNPSYPTSAIWAKLRAVYPFIGGTAASHTLNLINPAQPLTFTGAGLIHSATGVKFDNVGYANTGHSMAGLTAAGGIGYYSRTQKVNVLEFVMGAATGIGSADQLLFGFFNEGFDSAICDLFGFSSAARLRIPAPVTIGYFSASRLSANDFRGFKNGVEGANNVLTNGGSASNVPVWLGMYNVNDTPQGGTYTECAYAQINNGLTPIEELNYYNSIQAFQTALGRNVSPALANILAITLVLITFLITLNIFLTDAEILALDAILRGLPAPPPTMAGLAIAEEEITPEELMKLPQVKKFLKSIKRKKK